VVEEIDFREYEKCKIVLVLNEFFSGEYRHIHKFEESQKLKRYEVDISQLILTFRDCFNIVIFTIRQTVSTHLI